MEGAGAYRRRVIGFSPQEMQPKDCSRVDRTRRCTYNLNLVMIIDTTFETILVRPRIQIRIPKSSTVT